MDNEIEQEVAVTEDADTDDTSTPEPKTDWEAEATKWKRIAISRGRKLTKQDEPEPKPKAAQSDELDYGMKAYLRAEQIEPEHFGFVHEQMQASGLPLDKLLSNGYFQAQLKERRDANAIETATPSQTRGTGEPPQTQVDHWVDRGEMPPNTPENFELRTQVLNRRLEREKSANSFSANPIVMQ